jgi:uncharacterized lipoprotein YddW (UPF0748 family)
MKKVVPLLLLSGLLTGCQQTPYLETTPQNALFCENITDNVQTIQQLHITETLSTEDTATRINNDTPYGMWFPVMDYAEILTGQTEAAFRTAIRTQFENAKALGINTVFLQVRAFADAYYPSDYYAPGLSLSSDCTYDPLQIMLTEAHALGLSVHAWINPLRCQTDAQMQEMSDAYPIKQWYLDTEKRGTWLVFCDGRWWLNPAYPEVRQLIADGVTELVTNYDIDGVQIDDYFYPTTDASFDATAFQESGATNLSDWRKAQCSAMVQALYQAVKSVDDTVLFGISPQGTDTGNAQQFADTDLWCRTAGYCDYILPQLYFGLQNSTAPFAETAAFWAEKTTCSAVSLWIGICTYKLGQEDPWAGDGQMEWQTDFHIPSEEISVLLSMEQIDGIAIYDYATTFEPEDTTIQRAMETERDIISQLFLS